MPIQITVPVLKVLAVMLDNPRDEYYGLGLVKKTGLPGGTVYPVLARLESSGWLTDFWEAPDPRRARGRQRRYYRLTEEGSRKSREALNSILPPYARYVLLRHAQPPADAVFTT